MSRFLFLLLALSACSAEKSTKYSAPVPGAVLSVDAGGPDAALSLMNDVQATLQAHPEWAREMLSHGAEPPNGYSFKYKGRCGARSAVAAEVGRMMVAAVHRPPRCENVG